MGIDRKQLKKKIFDALMSAYPQVALDIDDVDVSMSDKDGFTWTSKIAFRLSKMVNKPPSVVADAILANISLDMVKHSQEATSGYINFDHGDFWEWVKEVAKIGKIDLAEIQSEETERRLIEHTSPNPNKAMHLGHLRNNVTGMAIANLWEAVGLSVIRDAVDNNRGIAIAKLMWGYLKHAQKEQIEIDNIGLLEAWTKSPFNWMLPEDKGVRPDKFVDELYVKGSGDFDSDKSVESIVRQFVVDWEQEKEEVRKLWKLVMDLSHAGQNLTLERLGNKWDKVWHESDHYQKGKDIVSAGLESGVFKRSNGAIVTDLSKYSIPDTVVEKSDGTSLYITQDLALTALKKETFSPDKMYWVIGPEQSLAMKQVFAVCDQLGIINIEDCEHISYGYMSIKGQGKMSSRAGNVVYIDELIDLVKEKIEDVMKENRFNDDLDSTSEKLALAAVKYSILKIGRNTDTAFDLNEAVSFHGNSGPYLVYTYARAMALLEKSNVKIGELEGVDYSDRDPGSIMLARRAAKYPFVVEMAAKNGSPNLVANYLHELAQHFNNYYSNVPIAREENELIMVNRVGLSYAVAIVIKDGLNLLGIETVERM